MNLEVLKQLIEMNEAIITTKRTLLNKHNNIITRRIKFNRFNEVKEHNPDEGFIQYSIALPVESIELVMSFTPYKVFHQIIDTLFSLYDIEKKTIKLETYNAPKRSEAIEYVNGNIDEFAYTLQLIENNGAKYVVFDFIIKA